MKEASPTSKSYSELVVGDVIRRGDLFRTDDGYLGMDNLGRLLGVTCLGKTIKKAGEWFRPQDPTQQR